SIVSKSKSKTPNDSMADESSPIEKNYHTEKVLSHVACSFSGELRRT
ncbi:MAG: hypothetical protein ACKVLC_01785, partial [Phycisphaerales bacterium]